MWLVNYRATLLTLLVLIVAGCLSVWLFVQSLSACGTSIVETVPSPNRTQKAVVFVADCGATTSLVTVVAILSAEEDLPSRGGPKGVFSATTGHGAAPEGPKGGPIVSVTWVSNTELHIRRDRRAEVFRQEPAYNRISIRYTFLE